MSSQASLVNEKLYQAKLLLQLLDRRNDDSLSYAAELRAVEAAAVELLCVGLQLFIDEIAESCQLKDRYYNVYQLQQALIEEERSHAVVETLVELADADNNWLPSLLAAHNRVFNGAAVNKTQKPTSAQAIQFQDVSAGLDVIASVNAFSDFVLQQRAFLGEW